VRDAAFERLRSAAAHALAAPLDHYKDAWVRQRLTGHLEAHGRDPERARRSLLAAPRTHPSLGEGPTACTTAFHRDPEQFDLLRTRHLPRLLEHSGVLRAWSVGCASGAEAYTLAMLAHEARPGPTHTIIGTDLHPGVLAQAENGGPFTPLQARSLPARLRAAYLVERAGGLHVRGALARHVRFARHDALTGPYAHGFDLIVCRNLAIYLDPEGKRRLARSVVGALAPGGVLFTGPADDWGPIPGLSRRSACFWERE
jgi:chemotaxis protein methyltransferase CheR